VFRRHVAWLLLAPALGCSSATTPGYSPSLAPGVGARIALGEAVLRFERGHFAAAEEAALAARGGGEGRLERLRMRAGAAAVVGAIRFQQERWAEAIPWLEEAYAIGVADFAWTAWAATLLAECYRELGREDEVQRVLQEATWLLEDDGIQAHRRADPLGEAAFQYSRAWVLHGQRRDDEAAAILRSLHESFRHPSDRQEAALLGCTALALAHLLIENGKAAQAVPLLERALEEWRRYRDAAPAWLPVNPLSRVSIQAAYACALRRSGAETAAVDEEIRTLREQAREEGYGPQAPVFQPPHIEGCRD